MLFNLKIILLPGSIELPYFSISISVSSKKAFWIMIGVHWIYKLTHEKIEMLTILKPSVHEHSFNS